MKLPIGEVVKVLSARREAGQEAQGVVRLSVMVALAGPVELGVAVRAALRPVRAGGRLHVEGFRPDALPQVNALSDAAVILCASQGAGPEAAAALWRAYAQAGVPCVVCGLFCDADEAAACDAALAEGGVEASDMLLGLDAAVVCKALGRWLVESLPDEAAAAAAANFPCCRRAMALELVSQACGSNAAVGLLGFVPGADLPVMTVTQVSLALRIASIYGIPLSSERVREVAAVVAGAFGLRAGARLLVRALPLPAFLVRAGVGAGGTYAVGRALIAYFERLSAAGEPPAACSPGAVPAASAPAVDASVSTPAGPGASAPATTRADAPAADPAPSDSAFAEGEAR